jgi:hypothetical protein
MSIAGICYAVARAPKVIPPSAVASVLLRIPLMKQVCQYNVYMMHTIHKTTYSMRACMPCAPAFSSLKQHSKHAYVIYVRSREPVELLHELVPFNLINAMY